MDHSFEKGQDRIRIKCSRCYWDTSTFIRHGAEDYLVKKFVAHWDKMHEPSKKWVYDIIEKYAPDAQAERNT